MTQQRRRSYRKINPGGRRRSSYRRRTKRRWNIPALLRWAGLLTGLILILVLLFRMPVILRGNKEAPVDLSKKVHRTIEERPELEVDLIDVNPYSRPGIELKQVNGIVVHYTANPGSTAKQNRDYFAGLATEHTTKASSHFVIGLEGEIVQCIPCDEISYCSNNRNSDTLAIECCIRDESGVFDSRTYDSLVELVSWLVCRYELRIDDVIRHYDVTGKVCPKDFVENPEKWDAFKEDVAAYIQEHGR